MSQNTKHTVQSKLGSVRVWFMTDPVGAGWWDLSPAQACKSGLFSLINICEIRKIYNHWNHLLYLSSHSPVCLKCLIKKNAWWLSAKRLRETDDYSNIKLNKKRGKTGENRLASAWHILSTLGFSFNVDKGARGWYQIIECIQTLTDNYRNLTHNMWTISVFNKWC